MNNQNVKKTPLYDEHIKRGGKIVEFGGFLLPVEYTGLVNEHNACRENVGVFDVSHMGEIFVEGEEATEYLNYLLTSNVQKQQDMRMLYGMALYQDGTIVDDLMIYKFNSKKYMIVVNASNIEKDYEWFLSVSDKYDVKVINKSNEFGQLALQGPNSSMILEKLTNYDVKDMKFYDFDIMAVNNSQMIVSRSGYTGGDGYEIYGQPNDIVKLFTVLDDDYKVTLCGLGCRDTLRFEGALPLYGHEISDKINPVMACLNFACDYDKNFIGRSKLLMYKQNPLYKLVGLELTLKAIARAEYEVFDDHNNVIGYVTTGYLLPGHEKSLALAMIKVEYAQLGTKVFVRIRKKDYEATVRDRKFMNKVYKK